MNERKVSRGKNHEEENVWQREVDAFLPKFPGRDEVSEKLMDRQTSKQSSHVVTRSHFLCCTFVISNIKLQLT